MNKVTHHRILTEDNMKLAATLISPQSGSIRAVIQFHAGTVIRKEFYFKFAHFLSQQGFAVLLFDYRGVGESRPSSLRSFEGSISDWGKKDAPAVLDWIQDQFPDKKIHLFAHSMGGQIVGLMHNWTVFDEIVVVASSSGNWNNFHDSYRQKIKWTSNLLFPITLPLFGYAPGKFGFGQDWPRGVAEEWWQNSRNNGRMSEFMNAKHEKTFYNNIYSDIKALFFSDDHMATPTTIPNFQLSYPSANVESRLIKPENFGFNKIGHFGLFKEMTKGPLWEETISAFLKT